MSRNCGLFRSLSGATNTLRQRRHEIGNRADGLAGRAVVAVERRLERVDQRRADHRTIGMLRDIFGGYAVPFYVCAVLQVIAAAIVLIRPKILKTV